MVRFLLILSLSFTSAYSQSLTDETLLNHGLELETEGQYEQALEIWSSAFTELDTPSLTIGREYIRLATEHNLRDYYETASSIYLWGLSAESIKSNSEALKLELAMLRPLAGQESFKEWQQLFEQENPLVYKKIHSFWQQLNPTPSTRYNERLIEHWERIAYAREHFDRRNDPPYGTDDRGVEYVRYGEPDKIKSGTLTLSTGEVYNDCRAFPGCNPDMMRDVVMNLDPNPYFEVWSYDRPNGQMQYNLIILFGEKSSGGFQKINVIEDMIPRRAFSLNDNRYAIQSPGGGNSSPGTIFTPGMIMQWLYYKQLISVDFYFVDRFTELAAEWDVGESPLAAARLGKFQGPMQEEINKMIKLQEEKKAPDNISTHEKNFPSIPLRTYHYRMLDEKGNPVTVTFVESQPRQVFLEDLAFNEDVLFHDESVTAVEAFIHYELTHGLLVKDANGEVLNRSSMPAELILDFREDLPSSSVFTFPYAEEGNTVQLYAELHNRHPESKPRIETPFPHALRGLGKLESTLPKPLSSDPDQLEMADLVLGWQMRHDAPDGTLFPFVVANNREIPEGEELAVHLEIYNLQTSPNGFTDFSIDYEVVPVRRMEWLRGIEQEFSLTLDQQTSQSRFTENLEIRTRELQPGRYKLVMTTTDNTSRQNVQREIEFRVVEREGNETVSTQ